MEIPASPIRQITNPPTVNIDLILDERARELGGEQLRRFDLKRTNKLTDRITRLNPDAAQFAKPFSSPHRRQSRKKEYVFRGNYVDYQYFNSPVKC